MEMYVEENPESATFQRPGKSIALPRSRVEAEWERVLLGSAKDDMMKSRLPGEAVLRVLREREKRTKPTIKMGPASKRK